MSYEGLKISILIPTKGKIFTKTVESVLAMLSYNASIRLDTSIIFAEGTLVTTVRSRLVQEFMKKNCSHLCFIDSDMTFEPNYLQKLIDHKKSVVCGVAKVRGGKSWNIFTRDGVTGKYRPHAEVGDDLIEIDATGCACIMIEKSVIKEILDTKTSATKDWSKLHEKYEGNMIVKETLFNLSKDRLLFNSIGEKSEDVLMCEYIKKCGYNIYADCSLKFGHINDIVIK